MLIVCHLAASSAAMSIRYLSDSLLQHRQALRTEARQVPSLVYNVLLPWRSSDLPYIWSLYTTTWIRRVRKSRPNRTIPSRPSAHPCIFMRQTVSDSTLRRADVDRKDETRRVWGWDESIDKEHSDNMRLVTEISQRPILSQKS